MQISNKIDSYNISNKKIILISIVVLLLSIYIAVLLFGKNSFSTLVSLEKQEKILKQNNQNMLIKNAKLNKEYFEIKNLNL